MLAFLHVYHKQLVQKEVQNMNVSLTSMAQMCLTGILNVGYCYMCNKYDWSKRKLQNMNVSYVCKQLITTHTIHLPLRHNCFWLAISMLSVITYITNILEEVAYMNVSYVCSKLDVTFTKTLLCIKHIT